MNSNIIRLGAMLAVLAASTAGLRGQFSITSMNYQGSINENGSPANGTYDLRFTVYDAATNGNIVGSPIIKEDVAISNGVFSVTLDFGTGVFDGSARWMELAVRPGDSTNAFSLLSPRQSVSSVPYAITASESFTISGSLPSTNLAGTYSETLLFTSGGNIYLGTFNGTVSGDGGGITNVNANTLGGLGAADFWQLGGNAGTSPGTDFLGTTDNQALELQVNNVRALRLEPTGTNGAVNVIGGSPINFVPPGVVGATIGGGGTLDDGDSTAHTNRVLADYGAVGGGLNNVAGGFSSTVAGGLANQILEFNSSNSGIGSGSGNVISNAGASAISGGTGNNIRSGATWSFIGGGFRNEIGANADYAVIPGGQSNVVGASYAFAGGRRAKANNLGSFVWADSTDADFASTANNQFLMRAGGGVGINTASPESALDVKGTITSQVGAGNNDNVTIKKPGSLSASNVRFVFSHRTTGDDLWLYGYDGSAFRNLQGWDYAQNVVRFPANGQTLYVDMASGNVGVGTTTLSNKLHVAGNVTIAGAVLAGPGIDTAAAPTYTWANDPDTGLFHPAGNNVAVSTLGVERLRVTAVGNVGIANSSPGSLLTVSNATCNGESWVNSSDRNLKGNFAPADPQAVLEKVAALEIQTWTYKSRPGEPHLGPVAQDFHAAFGLGADDKGIATVDADGVALVAIQGLNQKLEEQRAANAELQRQVRELAELVGALSRKLNGEP